MKKCIWCCQNEIVTPFKRKAHTIPASLGGKQICENVCDSCNSNFGTRTSSSPSVEIALKELLHLSQFTLLTAVGEKARLKSEFFDVNLKTHTLNVKPRYSLRPNFQENLCRQFKRGIYKIFLEERERQYGDGHAERFNFIREFARFNLGDWPVFYFIPKADIAMFSTIDIKNPSIRFTDYSDKIDSEFRMYEYMFLGHYIALPTSQAYPITLENYKHHIKQIDHPFGLNLREIKKAIDIDFAFQYVRK